MTNIRRTLWELPRNSKRILIYLENEAHSLPVGEVTIAMVGKKLGLSSNQMNYAMRSLRRHKLVKEKDALAFKMSAKTLSVNADTVERSDIMEMIQHV